MTKKNVVIELKATYMEDLNQTVIIENICINGEHRPGEVTGGYPGEPNEKDTKAFAIRYYLRDYE